MNDKHAEIVSLYRWATLYLRTSLLFLISASVAGLFKNWKLTVILLGGFVVFWLIGYVYALRAGRLEKKNRG